MKKSVILLVFLFALLGNFLMAQTPVLKVSSNSEKPVVLQELDVSVRIFGHLAETTMLMKFFNYE